MATRRTACGSPGRSRSRPTRPSEHLRPTKPYDSRRYAPDSIVIPGALHRPGKASTYMGRVVGDGYSRRVSRNDDDEPTPRSDDTLFVYGKGDDAYSVLRKRGESVELGALREVEEGKPLHGELVKLSRRAEHPLLFDVNVLHDSTPAKLSDRSGPAQVATDAYREGWEIIFGQPTDPEMDNDPGDLN